MPKPLERFMSDQNPPNQPGQPGSDQATGARSSRFAEWLYSHQKPEDEAEGRAAESAGTSPQLPAATPTREDSGTRLQVIDETLSELGDRLANIESLLRSTVDTYHNFVQGIQKALTMLVKNQETLAKRFDKINETLEQAIANGMSAGGGAAGLEQTGDATSQAMDQLGPPPPTAPPALLKDPTHVKARRIANAMVSDLEAYNRSILVDAIKQGTVENVLLKQIADMRSQYERRVPQAVRDKHDYLQEALQLMIYRKKAEALGLQVPGGAAPPPAKPQAGAVAAPAQAAAPAATGLRANVVLAGPVQESMIADIIQLLSNNRDTGVFRIASDKGEVIFYFVQGMIHDASFGALKGEKAFFEGFSINEGQFEFERQQDLQVERTIQMETSFLIIEALRRIDEGQAKVAPG
ncbi:MAG TPA: DUF4388 domain-containing protein [Candidatus Brocadiia bacterium]|nr:DUF4388 domain-containing protein [Candidatus Brocadiia bacterium]